MRSAILCATIALVVVAGGCSREPEAGNAQVPVSSQVSSLTDAMKSLQGVWRGVLIGQDGQPKLAENLGLASVDGQHVWVKWNADKPTPLSKLEAAAVVFRLTSSVAVAT